MLTLDSLLNSQARKSYVRGTHRSVDPETTWATLQPLLRRMGITRVANVTGLDRIGIPVCMSVRPNSRSLAVSQGKGVDLMSARVSAVMESVEAWHAEYNTCVVRMESHAELRKTVNVCDPQGLPFCKGSLFTESRPIPWVESTDLLTGRPVWAPYELVHANATIPAVPGSGCFLSSTNGLASGNNPTEAVLHATYEAVERDALCLWELATPDRWSARRVDMDSIDNVICASLIERFRAARITPMVWDITSDIRLPAFVAIISDEESDPLLNPIAAAFGSGCHCDRGVALSRALTEAAQSRLTAISGSRDDLTRTNYRTSQSESALDFHRQLARERHAPIKYGDIPTASHDTLTDDLTHVLDQLRRSDVDGVLAVDLSRSGTPLSVTRVIVPGLEGPTESQWYRPGRRLKARLA